MTAEDIVVMLLEQFDKKFTDEMKAKADKLGKTVYEVVIEASMIERECAIDS
jgi:cell division protein YceG involved in septum cleavage